MIFNNDNFDICRSFIQTYTVMSRIKKFLTVFLRLFSQIEKNIESKASIDQILQLNLECKNYQEKVKIQHFSMVFLYWTPILNLFRWTHRKPNYCREIWLKCKRKYIHFLFCIFFFIFLTAKSYFSCILQCGCFCSCWPWRLWTIS